MVILFEILFQNTTSKEIKLKKTITTLVIVYTERLFQNMTSRTMKLKINGITLTENYGGSYTSKYNENGSEIEKRFYHYDGHLGGLLTYQDVKYLRKNAQEYPEIIFGPKHLSWNGRNYVN